MTNTVQMIKDTVNSYDELPNCTMEILGQGSYTIILILDSIVMWIFV